jgi:drug/metabolite transporter (DMT)-like permease
MRKTPMAKTRSSHRGTAGVGAGLMLSSALMFAVLDGLIKLLGPGFSVWDISFYRFGVGLAVLLAISDWRRNPFRGHNQRLLFIRGVTGTIAFFCLVAAIHLVPISTAMVLFFSYPAFSALLSPLIFGERITTGESVSVLAALAGVGILFDFRLEGGLVGHAMALLGAASAGLAVAIVKKLRETNGSIIIYLYFCLLGFVMSLPQFIHKPHIPRYSGEWLMLGGIACSSILGQLLMNEGLRYCKSWEGGVFLMAEVVLTSILGIVFLGESATWRFWVGGALIFGSAIALNLRRSGGMPPEVIHGRGNPAAAMRPQSIPRAGPSTTREPSPPP